LIEALGTEQAIVGSLIRLVISNRTVLAVERVECGVKLPGVAHGVLALCGALLRNFVFGALHALVGAQVIL
jgi:hypothetical protein